jgi:hypothetical protein
MVHLGNIDVLIAGLMLVKVDRVDMMHELPLVKLDEGPIALEEEEVT